MILLGAFACAPAATSGIFAKYDILSQMSGGQDSNWLDVRHDANLSARQWELLNPPCSIHLRRFRSCRAGGDDLAGFFDALAERAGGGALGDLRRRDGADGRRRRRARARWSTARNSPPRSQAAGDKLQSDWNAADSPQDKLADSDQFIMSIRFRPTSLARGVVFALIAAAWGTSVQKSTQLRIKPLPRPQTGDENAPPASIVTAPATALWLLTGTRRGGCAGDWLVHRSR